MRKIKIAEHISLDGVIEHDGDYTYGAWTTPYRSPAGAAMLLEAYGTNFDLLLGRHTYDIWSGFWPTAGNFPMANGINAATKYIATHRPESLQWGPVKDLGSDIVAGIRDLKSTEGPDLIVSGSSTITSVLLKAVPCCAASAFTTANADSGSASRRGLPLSKISSRRAFIPSRSEVSYRRRRSRRWSIPIRCCARSIVIPVMNFTFWSRTKKDTRRRKLPMRK